ncbi:Fe-S cluster assembly protein SufD [Parvibaculum sp.]|uniref:Fe-S cluster assembly protein SufD n=1 Tax=Parvibaculum sp. TaxID=2024848 RepID=UPI000C98874C|nr:Fe-S cluster assembly protein SufD [Parvibaculum sp.]MAB14358.1 Fe-S cluster assembly protein SufD [Parvibaculum sp.]
MTDATAQSFIDTFERERASLPGADGWLAARREAAVRELADAGLPHRRLEDWKYTDLRDVLEKAAFTPAPVHQGAVFLSEEDTRNGAALFHAIDRYKIVFVNGRLNRALSDMEDLPEGVVLKPFADVLGEAWTKALIERRFEINWQAQSVSALNMALMADGVALHVEEGVTLDKPVHLIFLAADDGASHMRTLVRLEKQAQATVFETHASAGAAHYFVDLVTEVSLGVGATLNHIKLQDEAEDAVHLATMRAALADEAKLDSFTMIAGGGVSRGQTFVEFEGRAAEAHVNGAYALRGKQHADQFCVVDHAVPECNSHTHFKGVLDDESQGIFQGKVVVRPDAQQTDGRQMTNALLLSRDASINAKPELEIYADDVQCAHGSTIGELDKDALFYLRSRGIDEMTARQLLISAFLDEALDYAPHEEARAELKALVAGWFEAGNLSAEDIL